eukprot:Colp12_sorted_trinity150504_noHs@6816
MYKLDLPMLVQQKEQQVLRRRQQMEDERKKRIFDARRRTIGVDLAALSEQVAERKRREEAERQREDALASEMLRHDKIATVLDARAHNDLRNLQKNINDFRFTHQTKDTRREWDLNDPLSLKKEKPARVDDKDERCGVSSLQMFRGEDLDEKERSKRQKEQLTRWFDEQKREKNDRLQQEKNEERLYYLRQRELENRLTELEKLELEQRRLLNSTVRDTNKSLADEKRRNWQKQREQELQDNLTEIRNNLYGDMLTENPDAATSAFGPHRVVPDRWKGMTPEQLAEIRRDQEWQRRENEARRQNQELVEAAWQEQEKRNYRALSLLDRESERRRRATDQHVMHENKSLGSQQNAKLEYLNKVVYTNTPTDKFFDQFNTTTR